MFTVDETQNRVGQVFIGLLLGLSRLKEFISQSFLGDTDVTSMVLQRCL